jgi:hypothetical protein
MTDLQALSLAYYMPHALAVFHALGAVWLVYFFRFVSEAVCNSH